MCQSLRVPVATFRPNPTQRRAWKRNQGEVTVSVGVPSVSLDRLNLWERFHRHGHETKGWPAETEGDPGTMLENPFRTEEWTYDLGNRLIAVAYADALPLALSAIYCYYDPTEGARSLGTFNILSLLASARERKLPHVYLGYYVAGCSITGIQAQVSPERSAPAQWNMGGVQCLVTSTALRWPPRS